MKAVPNFITIRGYAIAFDRMVNIAGLGLEIVDREALDAMLSPKNRRVPVRWIEHDDDAQQIASDVHLFADDYGLGFSAMLDVRSKAGRLSANWSVLSAMTRAARPLDQCSVGEFAIAESEADNIQGMACRRVVKATIGHITICDNAAYGPHTAVWRTDVDLSAAPWRIQQMATRWELGRQTSELETKARRAFKSAEAIVRGRGDAAGGDLSSAQVTAFEAHARDVAAYRRQIAGLKSQGAPR